MIMIRLLWFWGLERDDIFLEYCKLLMNDMDDPHLRMEFKFVLTKRYGKEQLIEKKVVKDQNQFYYVNNNEKIEGRLKNEVPLSTTHGGTPNTTVEKEKDFKDFCFSRSMPRQDQKRKSVVLFIHLFPPSGKREVDRSIIDVGGEAVLEFKAKAVN
jgi:hypothetical protein